MSNKQVRSRGQLRHLEGKSASSICPTKGTFAIPNAREALNVGVRKQLRRGAGTRPQCARVCCEVLLSIRGGLRCRGCERGSSN